MVRTDKDLLRGLQAGLPEALVAFEARWAPRLFRFCMRQTGGKTTGERALRQTFAGLHRSRHLLTPGQDLAPRLYGLALQAAGQTWAPEPHSFVWTPRADDPPRLRTRLVQALGALDWQDRGLLLLHMEGLGPDGLALVSGRPVEEVGPALALARLRMTRHLGGGDD
jgi:DNA-directed RNA polymerase specialized sigma24 family protein